MVERANPGNCSACGSELPPAAAGALCPKCLLRLGLSEQLAQNRPSLEEIDSVDSSNADAHSDLRPPSSVLRTADRAGLRPREDPLLRRLRVAGGNRARRDG